MIIHDLEQNSSEWHEFRANHDGASEAPAMMSKSKYQSRTDLMYTKKFGAKDVDAATQRLFDRGHEAEAKAISIAESIVGEPLFPVTGSKEGTRLSASFDGLTMDHSIAWEHKLWNEKLALAINSHKESGEPLPEHYTIQLDQQLLVSGAEKALFMCSDGTEVNAAWCWYVGGDLSYLEPAWDQFNKDLSVYEPTPEAAPVEVKSIDDLPALKINVSGMVQSSNLKLYEEQALAFINSISTDLKTDDDFANAEKLVKFCKSAEDEIETAKKAVLAQTADIDQLFTTIDKIKEEMRQKRLSLNKLVKEKKERIRRDILQEAQRKLSDHVNELSLKAQVNIVDDADFLQVMKGKKTIKSLRDACDSELARAKIATDQQATLAIKNQAAVPEDYRFLFNDFRQIAFKSNDDFLNLVNARIAEHKQKEAARLEAERRRIQEEEERKARAEAERKADEERERIRKEEQAKAQAEAQRQREEEKPQAEQPKKDNGKAKQAAPASPVYEEGTQLIAMYMDGYGFLPMIRSSEGVEQYRGEYQSTAVAAIQKCEDYLRKNNG